MAILRNQSLSQRAQTSTTTPRSCRRVLSHSPRCGLIEPSKPTTATRASSQIAARLQRNRSQVKGEQDNDLQGTDGPEGQETEDVEEKKVSRDPGLPTQSERE